MAEKLKMSSGLSKEQFQLLKSCDEPSTECKMTFSSCKKDNQAIIKLHKQRVCESISDLTHDQKVQVAKLLSVLKSTKDFLQEKGLGIQLNLKHISEADLFTLYKLIHTFSSEIDIDSLSTQYEQQNL